ncbi:hypothetical protein NEOLEDRAFT_1159477 [Neolentinus lepideus HHB14362 ss-1]|uniref:CCZ1/INTU/HSP4 first Longin domain-containing protein n=1 Tax=Neolentinus lepideus HHB14362 ss-1 TaxID=1314782 RepID=A0A165MH70_9AGAM|nr:hypothetical protein NEOLEDRAFT_1159477 [Neolentinus lepideus HHB14362 ss-1]
MSRLPPGLLYLTIYNPTLRPPPTSDRHDEDAEEQAHILFYTARERAVSRDRILRQVGLAKALVNFADMFSEGVCDNVHSQTRRMVMVSPEPDYWIHACFELARTRKVPRSPSSKAKPKAKEREQDQSKGKGKETEPSYDYDDSSLHDLALRGHLLRGYELFKVKHGSFTSILDTLGQQALESYLERFFTVWAWKWDIDDDSEFSDHLGVSLHPLCKTIIPFLDTLISDTAYPLTPFLLSPPHFVPSTHFTSSDLPSTLARHLLSVVSQPRRPPTSRRSSKQALQTLNNIASSSKPPLPTAPLDPLANDPIITKHGTIKTSQGHQRPGSISGFLAMPNVNMSGMDVRKWSWPGYLSFGKGQARKSAGTSQGTSKLSENVVSQEKDVANNQSADTLDDNAAKTENGDGNGENQSTTSESRPLSDSKPIIEVTEPPISPRDTAIIPVKDSPVENPQPRLALPLATDTLGSTAPTLEVDETTVPMPAQGAERLAPSLSTSTAGSETASLAPSTVSVDPTPGSSQLDLSDPPPTFSVTSVYIADNDDPVATKRRRLLYLTKHHLTLALLSEDENALEEADLQVLAERSVAVLQDIRQVIKNDEEQMRAGEEDQLPSVAKILQPKNRHVISQCPWTVTSEGFKSTSEHLYDGHQLLQRDPGIVEIFSRGQQPQHWHISKRGLGIDKDGNSVDGSVFMEVLRKEESLIDVDDDLAGVVRRFVNG